MYLRHLSLTNFRTYARLELDLPAQAILLYGDNAQGKTSLLEAIYVLATGRSSHTASDRQLINWLASEEGLTPHARLAADVVRADRALHIDMVLLLEPARTEDGWRFRKQIKVNGAVVLPGPSDAPPAVSLAASATTVLVPASFTLTATATDDKGIAKNAREEKLRARKQLTPEEQRHHQEMERLYRLVNDACEGDPAVLERARLELVELLKVMSEE